MAKWGGYFIFSKAYFFIVGLLFILSLIDMKLVDVLFTNLINAQEKTDVRRATIIVNMREGASEVLKTLALIFTKYYMRRIGGVILFNLIYIVGLVLLYVCEHSKTRRSSSLIVATLLISLGKTGFILLISFIGDQLKKPAKIKLKKMYPNVTPPQVDEDYIVRLTLVWWVFPWGLAAIIAPFFGLSVTKSIILLTTLLGVALVILCAGDCRGSYAKGLQRDNDENQEHQDEANVKEGLKVILVWISLILYTIVVAAGTTFFLYQADKINGDFPAVTFLIFKHIANVFISVGCSKMGNNLFTQLSAGMLLAFLSSVLAFAIKVHNRGGIWLLTPQYILLGAAEGLARDAFEGYFRDRFQSLVHIVHIKRVKYLIQFFVGLGKFLSYVMLSLALGFSVLDADDLRSYYKILMGASSASLLVALYFRFNENPIRPRGLTTDVFFPSGGQAMTAVAPKAAPIPKGWSPQPKPLEKPNKPCSPPRKPLEVPKDKPCSSPRKPFEVPKYKPCVRVQYFF